MQPNKLFCNGLNIAPQDGWALSFTPFPKRNTSRAISTLQTQYTSLFSNCKQIYTHCAQIIWCFLQLQQPKSNCYNLSTQPLLAGVPSFVNNCAHQKREQPLCGCSLWCSSGYLYLPACISSPSWLHLSNKILDISTSESPLYFSSNSVYRMGLSITVVFFLRW